MRSWRSYGLGKLKMKNWVILFVRSGAEQQVVRTLKEKLDAAEYLPFIPVKEAPRRSRGVIHKVRKSLFPGYVFIQTEIASDSIAEKLRFAIADVVWNNDIYSILHYGADKKDVALREKERLHWERLLDDDFCITGSVGVIEGDAVRVTSGTLVGMESRIKRINRHKREAVVEMEVMGAVREVRLMLEVVERVKI
jgi:transcriptional antiterminator NusG